MAEPKLDKIKFKNPHDRLFCEIYGERRNCMDLFELALTDDEFNAFDWRTLRALPTVHFMPDSSEKQMDLLYSVKSKRTGADCKMVFMLEHKSWQDAKLMVQLLEYQTAVYRKQMIPILPILIYHGRGSEWPYNLEFHQNLASDSPEMIEIFGRQVLNFIVRCVNLRRPQVQRQIMERKLETRLILYIFDRIWDANLDTVDELLRMGQELDDTRRKVLIGKAVDYICRVRPEITREKIMEVEREILPQEVLTSPFLEGTLEDKMQEGLKRGHEQGLKQGLKQGLEQGHEQGHEQGLERGAEQKARNMAQIMLQNNEPIDKICSYTGLSSGTVRELSR